MFLTLCSTAFLVDPGNNRTQALELQQISLSSLTECLSSLLLLETKHLKMSNL
jgi:hypothetical protein